MKRVIIFIVALAIFLAVFIGGLGALYVKYIPPIKNIWVGCFWAAVTYEVLGILGILFFAEVDYYD